MAAGTTILMMYAGCFGLVGFVALTGTALYLWGRRNDRRRRRSR